MREWSPECSRNTTKAEYTIRRVLKPVNLCMNSNCKLTLLQYFKRTISLVQMVDFVYFCLNLANEGDWLVNTVTRAGV